MPRAHRHTMAGGAAALRLLGPEINGQATRKYGDDSDMLRRQTRIEADMLARESAVSVIVDALPEDDTVTPQVDLFLPEGLKDAVFVGHLVRRIVGS